MRLRMTFIICISLIIQITNKENSSFHLEELSGVSLMEISSMKDYKEAVTKYSFLVAHHIKDSSKSSLLINEELKRLNNFYKDNNYNGSETDQVKFAIINLSKYKILILESTLQISGNSELRFYNHGIFSLYEHYDNTPSFEEYLIWIESKRALPIKEISRKGELKKAINNLKKEDININNDDSH